MKAAAVVWCAALSLLTVGASASSRDVQALLKPCSSDETCQFYQDKFKSEYAGAFKRRYSSQRNVAYMLEDRDSHSDHGVVRNWIAACAWRAVIVNSRSREVDDSDRSNLEFACRRLPAPGKAAAAVMASQLMGEIYERPLAAGFKFP